MKSIAVSDETHAELKSWGEFGESFDDVIKRMIAFVKRHRKMTKDCMYSDEKPCEFLERTGRTPRERLSYLCIVSGE